MTKRFERRAFGEFKRMLPHRKGWRHFFKPQIPCDDGECEFVQPDMGALNRRTGEVVVGDAKYKERLNRHDVAKLCDDSARAGARRAYFFIPPHTRASDGVLDDAEGCGIRTYAIG